MSLVVRQQILLYLMATSQNRTWLLLNCHPAGLWTVLLLQTFTNVLSRRTDDSLVSVFADVLTVTVSWLKWICLEAASWPQLNHVDSPSVSLGAASLIRPWWGWCTRLHPASLPLLAAAGEWAAALSADNRLDGSDPVFVFVCLRVDTVYELCSQTEVSEQLSQWLWRLWLKAKHQEL